MGVPSQAKSKLRQVPEITAQEMCAEMVAEDLKIVQRHVFLRAYGRDTPLSVEN